MASSSVNQRIHDAFMERGVRVTRTEAQVQNEILGFLEELSDELRKKLAEVNWDSADILINLVKLDRLEKSIKSVIEGYYEQMAVKSQRDIVDMAKSEMAWMTVVNEIVGVDLFDITLSKSLLKSLTSNVMIQGAPSSAWWMKQSDDLVFDFMREMRIGLSQGESLNELVRRVRGRRENGFADGIISKSTREAEALVRTSIQSVMTDVRMETYRQNANVLQGIQWLTALDLKVCVMCRPRDGGVWDLDGNPVNDIARRFDFMSPPIHFNDRCILIPVLRSWEDLASQYGGNTEIGKAIDRIPESTRSSMDGQVPASLTFPEWLRQKDLSDPIEVKKMMGPGKYNLWKSGRLPLRSFLDDRGNPLPISKLS